MRLVVAIIFLLLTHQALAQEQPVAPGQPQVVFVSDVMRVGIRANPTSKEKPVKVVKSGTPLTVVERFNTFYKVRTDDGTEGWVSQAYVTEEQPPRQRLKTLKRKYQLLTGEVGRLRTEAGGLNETNTTLSAKLLELTAERDLLQQRVVEPIPPELDEPARPQPKISLDWLNWAAGGVLLMALTFGAGALWYRQQAMKRLGGLRI